MRRHGSLEKDEEINSAAWVAARGAGVGAARWGIYSAILAGAGWAFSPIYRNLTVQFKVFLQMSGMIFGSMIEADRRLIQHEQVMRAQKRLVRDAEMWRHYEEEFDDVDLEPTPTPATKAAEKPPSAAGGVGASGPQQAK
ncbi:uncharacterized protein J3D65DRAFT_483392 [Phyllosticta citribraziliensis]|uniref:Imidazoleglycerol-phosphate dehydratase n=1 Tax=Phyllosticta citribraziliensis TaxID=989973 RepID=A0ABR1LIL1_9PEZI